MQMTVYRIYAVRGLTWLGTWDEKRLLEVARSYSRAVELKVVWDIKLPEMSIVIEPGEVTL